VHRLNLPPSRRPPLSSALPRWAGVRGFTLIELMVTLAVAGLLMRVAAPSMTRMINANRVQTEASGFMNDLQFARSEAIKQGQPVTVCPSADGSTCLAANTWRNGWIVFSDTNGNAAVDSPQDTVLRKRTNFKGNDTLVAAPTTTAVIFNREGFTSGLGTSVVTFKLHAADGAAKSTRCIAVGIGGRLATQSTGEGSCS
jgi:type IV fimbrial biogenesis protein FimT